MDEVTNMIYVENGGSGPYKGSDNVTVINGGTNGITTVPTGKGTDGVAVDMGLNLIYVSDWGSNSVTVINGATNKTLTLTDPNAKGPNDVVVNGTTHLAYVANGGGYPFGGSNNVTVIGILPLTITSLTSSLNPSGLGQSVTFTATVASASGTPTGNVVFYERRIMIGSAALSNGSATLSTSSLPVGSHPITAAYQGSSSYSSSTSAALTQVVRKLPFPSKTSLTTSGSPSDVGQAVTFTATVTSEDGAIPDGETVTFYAGSEEIGTGTTSGGVATFTTSSLAVGTHTIKAEYPGDATFKASKGSVHQVVTKD